MIAETMVEVRCSVCAGESHQVVCPAHEVQVHLKYLHRFHQRRLRPGPGGRPPREALADRADFTQDYATDIVACRCGLLFRLAARAEVLARRDTLQVAPWFDAFDRLALGPG